MPKSIWATYSSFANLQDSVVLLGVGEKSDHSFELFDIPSLEKLVKDFLNKTNNRTMETAEVHGVL